MKSRRFQLALERAANWVVDHWRPLGFAGAALVVVLLVWWLDRAVSQSRFNEVFVAQTQEPVARESPDVETQSGELERLRQAAEQARRVLEEERQQEQSRQEFEVTRREIETMLEQWASSWASQDVGSYLSYYAEDFDTPYQISRGEWASSRIRRIEEPRWIRVQLEQIDIVQLEADFAALSVTQLYATPGYADRSRKHIDLVKTAQGWRIARERAVETVRLDVDSIQ